MSTLIKTSTSALVVGSLIFTACSKHDADPIPDAPEAAIQTVISEFANGNGGILWQAMPTSYQADVDAVVQLAGTKLDAEVYDPAFALLGRLGQVVEKQKAFILNAEMGGEQDAEALAKLEKAFPSVVGLLQTLASSEISTIAGMQSFQGQQFFDTTVSQLLGYGMELSQLSDEAGPSIETLRGIGVVPVEVTETEATLEFSVPGEPVEVKEFVKVENRWVPAEMASEWAQGIADMKAQLEAITPEQLSEQKPQIMGMLTMVEGVLDQIEAAETQEQFDQALQGAMMPFMGLMMMGQGFGGGSSAPAPAPAAMPALPSAP